MIDNAACLLKQLDSLEFKMRSHDYLFGGFVNGLQFSADNLDDFSLFLNACEHLTKLTVPIRLFEAAFKNGSPTLKILGTLDLFPSEADLQKISCQNVLEMVGNTCPELTVLRYDCTAAGNYTAVCCNAAKGCVTDFGVLQPLNKLRSLTLRLGGITAMPVIWNLSSQEFLTLYLPDSVAGAKQMMQLAILSSNLNSLELLWSTDLPSFNNDVMPLKCILSSGALARLQKIRLCVPDCHSGVYDQIHLITTIPTTLSLRKIEIVDLSDFEYDCPGHSVVKLPPPNMPGDLAGPESGITYAIGKAENVTDLCFSMHWNDSYLQLEQLLLAMQHGSLKRLVVKLDWFRARMHFGIDRRVISSILPAGCMVAEWNVSIESKLTSIVIGGRKLGQAAAHSSDQDEDVIFWVRLEAQ